MSHNPSASIEDQAVERLLRWCCGQLSPAGRHAYLAWLKASPDHVAQTVHWCRRYSTFRLRTTALRLFLESAKSSSNTAELPPSPELSDAARFRVTLIRAARSSPVDTETLVRNALEERAARRRR